MESKLFGCEELNLAALQEINGGSLTVIKVKALISTFLTDTQISTIVDILGSSSPFSIADIQNTILNSLTLSQLVVGLSLFNKLGI